MPKRTQIICMHEGKRNKEGMLHSIDPIFASAFIRAFKPNWLRVRLHTLECGDNNRLLEEFPKELKLCAQQGGDTTLVVLADVDDNHKDCDALKAKYQLKAKAHGFSDEVFERVVFIFPKDRLENWIEFINTGHTYEHQEGHRVEPSEAADAARKLASMCKNNDNTAETFPPSLQWSCRNWKALVERMRDN